MDWQELEREAEEARVDHATIPAMDTDAHMIRSKAAFKSGVNAAALMGMDFPPIRYVVCGYIAEGLTILAGAPKIGKSWMALDIAVSVASGRPVFGQPCEQGDVLYLALEDNLRRLKSRLLTLGIEKAPPRLTLCTEWPSIAEGAESEIVHWLDSVAKPVLVIVDVLAKIRDDTSGKDPYAGDYKTMTGLQSLAGQRGLAVVALHHTRNMVSDDDPFDTISGTRGLTGAADSALVLKKENGTPRGTLYGRGRDIEEIETALEFDCHNATWKAIGPAAEVGKTDERHVILQTLKEADNPLSPREVSDLLGLPHANVRQILTRMAASDEIIKPKRGLYTCHSSHNVTTKPSSIPNCDIVTDVTGIDTSDDMEGWVGESPSQTASRLGQIAGAA